MLFYGIVLRAGSVGRYKEANEKIDWSKKKMQPLLTFTFAISMAVGTVTR